MICYQNKLQSVFDEIREIHSLSQQILLCVFYFKNKLTEIVKEVRRIDRETPFRPCLEHLGAEDYITSCVKACWNEDAEQRPDIRYVRVRLKEMQVGRCKFLKRSNVISFCRLV